ncbi:hypothetical protein [Thalassotalea agarivorans]|uniref:Ca-activated chloride channel family protein n=1 Tax=Thalassotalea agarivorans TaxID=349064 RepID=A0A1I0ERJ3_THASX|nr:hypothetical protein [Thalassotalea agarivorans]SET48072.1 Ca-activated chloride channel family protein [Thalassotalea agarivorans]
MVAFNFVKPIKQFATKYNVSTRKVVITGIAAILLFVVLKPQAFLDLWLTRDQQGALLFKYGYYEKAANRFNDVHWKAYSNYGAEKFKDSALLYAQFNNDDDKVAQANAYAHGRDYVKARNLYKQVLKNNPDHEAANNNLAIVQALIDEANQLAENQQQESSDGNKELGDEPQSSDGAERKQLEPQQVEQLSAEQLLLDPSLNEMWLRQVQKNPSRFLAQKFYIQQNYQAQSQETDDE